MTPKIKKEIETTESLEIVRDILQNTKASINKALKLLDEKEVDTDELVAVLKDTKKFSEGRSLVVGSKAGQRIIEGVFSGEHMVGGDGLEYNVPANYASKSKLVEGDILKLTILNDGSFVYKQIGPVERDQQVVDLAQSEEGDWYAIAGKNKWRLLTASVTYFHGEIGDQVVILTPKDSKSKWAAVENIIKVKS